MLEETLTFFYLFDFIPVSVTSIVDILIVAFVVIIIGGIGSIRGAFVAAILIGLIDTLGRSFLDDFMMLFLSDQNAETAAPEV